MKEKTNGKNDDSHHIKGIHCDVASCAYHDGSNYCTAANVKIGPSYAVSSTETICATFTPRYFRSF